MPGIHIYGAVQRTFIYPARIETAFAHYLDPYRLFRWLKHVGLVQDYGENRFRVLYHTTEMGVYGVSLYCDIEVITDLETRTIRVQPFEGQARVPAHASMQNLTAQGTFFSESIFHDGGDETSIDYHLSLDASMPVPLAAQVLIPKSVLGKIAQSIAMHRMDEIANEFIRRSLASSRAQG
jgi:hypothetical protein